MQRDHVLKKLNFYLLTPSPGPGAGGMQAEIWYCVAAIVILLNIICDMTMFFKMEY